MIYLKNNTILQELYIPRQDYISNTTGSSGTYAEGYADGYESGYTSGSTDGFDSGYTEGYSSGETHQKGLLTSTEFTENGEYEREDGWSAITVNVSQSSSVLEGKEIVVSEDITVVTPDSGYDGFSAVTVDATEYGQTNYDSGFDDGFTDGYSSGSSEGYDSGYTEGYQSGSTDGFNSGYTSGETHQKSLLVSTAFTENGSYQRENGYSAITVNVPQSSIEPNKSFTATSNGDYTIEPTQWEVNYETYSNAKWIKFSKIGNLDPSENTLVLTVMNSDDENSYVDIYLDDNGDFDYDDNWNRSKYGRFYWYAQNGYQYLEFEDITFIDLDVIEEQLSGGYDAMSAVTLSVNVPQTGHTDQELQDAYDSGYTSGENNVISTFSSITITQNGQYGSSAHPMSSITVNVPTGSTATLGVGSFSANGTYSASTDNLDGYSAITINVPQTGGTSVKYVEYLETDGGLLAWDTSVRITDINDVVYFDFMPINWGSGQSPVGSWFPFLIDGDGSDNFNALIRCFLFDSPANGLCFEAFDYADYKAMKYSGFTVDTRNNCIFSKNGLTINESVIQFSASNVFNTRTICINGEFNGIGGPVLKSAMGRYYGFKLIHSGRTISDLRPCLDENDVPCFYDEVSQTYIYHQGSGTPVAGSVIPNPEYQSGYTDGQNSIISTFTAATATKNGVYGSSANPYSSVTVNVPQTGHTDQEMDDAYDSGYTSGYTDGYDSGYTSGQTDGQNSGYTEGYNSGYTEGQNDVISTFSSITITENGQYGDSAHPMSSITVTVPQSGSSLTLIHPTRERNINGTKTYYAYAYAPSIEYYSHKEGSYTVVETDAFFYPNTGYFDLLNVSTPNQEDGFISIYYQNGDLLYDSTEWNGGTIICTTGNSHTADSAGTYDWMLLKLSVSSVVMTEGADADLTDKYAMSAITIVTNVDTASTYQSGYTDGSASIASLIDRSITEIVIPSGVTKIGEYAFYYCTNLSSITIPNSVTSIGYSSFQNCSGLNEVNIGSGITKIEMATFRNCSSLTVINISATTAPTITNANAFQGVPSTGTVHYPQGSDYSSWQSNQYLSGWTFSADI